MPVLVVTSAAFMGDQFERIAVVIGTGEGVAWQCRAGRPAAGGDLRIPTKPGGFLPSARHQVNSKNPGQTPSPQGLPVEALVGKLANLPDGV